MPITVELQDMHSYSVIMIVAVILFVVLSLAAVIALIVMKCRKQTVRPQPVLTVENRENIKQKYCGMLYNLEKKCRDNKISNRKAYQELSKIIRHFVYAATGIKVHNYTLQEIKGTNITGLYDIVSECYAPEFAIDKNGDIYGSITKARKVIEGWN